MPALWPSGPAELPGTVDLAGIVYLVPAVPTLKLAAGIAAGLAIVPELLAAADRAAVTARLKHPTDPLEVADIQRATVHLIARLAGIETGVNGWRAAVRLCATLTTEWPRCAGALLDMGICPDSGPLWQVCAGLYRTMIDNPYASADDTKHARMQLFQPISKEPAWMRAVKPAPPLSAAQAQAGAAALFERATGRPAKVMPCRVCGRIGGHTSDCPKHPQPPTNPLLCVTMGETGSSIQRYIAARDATAHTAKAVSIDAYTADRVDTDAVDIAEWQVGRNDAALRRYWKYGKGAAKIRWGTPGDLTRCHRNLRKYLGSDDAWGYCQRLHIELFGRPNPKD